MSTPDPKVTGSPESIWLIYGEIDTDTAHDECHEIGWCDEPLDSADVRYVRGDVADRQAAEAEALRRERDTACAALTRAGWEYIPNGICGPVWKPPVNVAMAKMRRERDEARGERNELSARLEQTRTQLKSVQWSGGSMDRVGACPCCGCIEDEGHAPDCALHAAIRPAPAAAPERAEPAPDMVDEDGDDDTPGMLGCGVLPDGGWECVCGACGPRGER